MSLVAKVKFKDYKSSISKALDTIEADKILPVDGHIIIKPNLVNTSPPPVTTNVDAAEAVFLYCKKYSNAKISICEGSGSGDTFNAFKSNGYTDLAGKYGIDLVDFNLEKAVQLKSSQFENDQTLQLDKFHIPVIALDAFIISLPVLKDHSITDTTISMKNMFGIAPSPFYKGAWNKSQLHSPCCHSSVVDVCLYKRPGLSIVDANIALTGMHLSGTPKNIGLILAGTDPVAVDTIGSSLLGHNPEDIKYLNLAHGKLGTMKDIEII